MSLSKPEFRQLGRDRWEILIDGEKWGEVHRTIFGKKPSFPPICSDFQEIFDAYEFRRVKNYLLWLLSKQSYHSQQLAKMLRERLVQQKTIVLALKDLQDAGFLDDEGWLNSFIQIQKKKYGLPIILSKLRAKGITSYHLEEKDPQDELLAIQQLLQTRYRNKDLTDFKTRQKVFAALMRKGFSYDNIRSFVN